MTNEQRANTIIEQMGGFGRLGAMTGANNFIFDDKGITFKFKGSRKVNCVKVELTGNDDYTMRFYKVGRVNFKEVEVIEGVYNDMLINIFESTTGLYLSL